MPQGYKTYDSEGQPVIQSELDGLDWFTWAHTLIQARGRGKEKAALRAQLARSVGDDNGGGRIYELIAALEVSRRAVYYPAASVKSRSRRGV